MKEYAQLADFIIRYISHETYTLDMSVGLDPKFAYPQIIYVPDHQDYCKPLNDGKPKTDCLPLKAESKCFQGVF